MASLTLVILILAREVRIALVLIQQLIDRFSPYGPASASVKLNIAAYSRSQDRGQAGNTEIPSTMNLRGLEFQYFLPDPFSGGRRVLIELNLSIIRIIGPSTISIRNRGEDALLTLSS